MKITLNNKEEHIDAEEVNIIELLKLKKFTFKMLVIKVNGFLVKKENYPNTLIRNGDKVSVIHLISGG
jgi:thiamine biosynthesis protein ThiS